MGPQATIGKGQVVWEKPAVASPGLEWVVREGLLAGNEQTLRVGREGPLQASLLGGGWGSEELVGVAPEDCGS